MLFRVIVLIAVALGGTGCGQSPSDTSDEESATAIKRAAQLQASADPDAIPPAQVCAFIKKATSRVRMARTRDGAMLTLTLAISEFYTDRGALQDLKLSHLDATLKQACPAVRTAALKAARIDNFADL